MFVRSSLLWMMVPVGWWKAPTPPCHRPPRLLLLREREPRRRTAILLIGGDKTGQWESWYYEMVPIADVLYDEHLGAIEKEGAQE